MSRFTCNTWEEVLAARQDDDFDVVIIGSGMYGAYAAAKLYERGSRMGNQKEAPRVLVLESGPFLVTEHVQNMPRRSISLTSLVAEELVGPGQSNEPVVKHMRCVGGKSPFWGGWSPRYQSEDMDRVDEEGDKLWPEDVSNYLFQTGGQGGYEYAERETGVFPVQDFIRGPLYEALKSRAEQVVNDSTVPSLKAVLEPPIAVQGEGPGSGLFGFDKYSSLPSLLDSIGEDIEGSSGQDARRKLFVVPYAEVLKLETENARVRQLVVALADPAEPRDKSRARVVRLDLKPSAMVVLAGNTINSTRLALNSFPVPAPLRSNGELMGRNLMYHVRGNHTWRIMRDALELPEPDPATIKTAALHVTGSAPATGQGQGQFHFQFYAAPNMDVQLYPGASKNPERFLYQMAPNIEDVETIREAQKGLGNNRIVIGIRTVGETFGDRSSPIGSNTGISWMSVNPFGGQGDDVYYENGHEFRIPKAYVNLAKTTANEDIMKAQDKAAFDFIEAMAGSGTPSSGDPPAVPGVVVMAEMPVADIPNDSYELVTSASGRFFVGRFGGQIRVLDGECTHEACAVDWRGNEGTFNCPCHPGVFAADGSEISGPPPAPLKEHSHRIVGAKLEITRSESVEPIELLHSNEDGIGTTYHEVGTLWMGTDYRKSVTDVNGRFHHVNNAYCVDQSIFPTAGSANPVLTGIALSRKIAESIVDRYRPVEFKGDEAGYETLYRGNLELDGWETVAGGGQNFFDISEHTHPVIGAGVDNTIPSLGVLWYSRKMFKDFVLKLDWRVFSQQANSGIFLRMPQPDSLDEAFYDSSIEVQIDEQGYDPGQDVHGSSLHKTGAVYEVFPARSWGAKVVQPRSSGIPGYWNSYEIKLQGSAIEVRLNGALVSSGTFPGLLAVAAPASDRMKRSEGFIGLQCHTEVIQFRNIRIKTL
jgi:choline dehydrogenase-like flavoprotein